MSGLRSAAAAAAVGGANVRRFGTGKARRDGTHHSTSWTKVLFGLSRHHRHQGLSLPQASSLFAAAQCPQLTMGCSEREDVNSRNLPPRNQLSVAPRRSAWSAPSFPSVRYASSVPAQRGAQEARRKAVAIFLHHLDLVALEKSSGSLYSLGEAIKALTALEKSATTSLNPLLESWNLENPELQKLITRFWEIGRRRAELRSYRTMTQSAQNKEIIALLICGFSGAFAAAIHPIFLLGTFGGALSIATQRKTLALRQEGVEELARLNAENRTIQLAIDERLRVLRSQLEGNDSSVEC